MSKEKDPVLNVADIAREAVDILYTWWGDTEGQLGDGLGRCIFCSETWDRRDEKHEYDCLYPRIKKLLERVEEAKKQSLFYI